MTSHYVRKQFVIIMFDMLVAMLVALLFITPSYATAATVSEPVGVIGIDIESNATTVVSMPFSPFNGSLDEILADQLVGNTNELLADQIMLWDEISQQYDIAFKSQSGGWLQTGTNAMPALFEITLGDGFLIQNRHESKRIIISGYIITNNVTDKQLVPGFNLVGMPGIISADLNDSGLSDAGVVGGGTMSDADCLITGNGVTNWMLNLQGHPLDRFWVTGTGTVASVQLNAGVGFWYFRKTTNNFEWVEVNEMSMLNTSTNQPVISAVSVSNGLVRLVVDGSGYGLIELFKQDVATNDSWSIDASWELAIDNVSAGNEIIWDDPTFTNVYCRIYVAAEQYDSDSDDLSDAKELLVYKTDDLDSDTDNDGLDDGVEVLSTTTEPLVPDTDQDGMSDGSEVNYSFNPLGSNEYARLPWDETFDELNAGPVNGQHGWQAGSANVQTDEVVSSSQALVLLEANCTNNAKQLFGAYGHTNVWIDMFIKPQAGALPNVDELPGRSSALLGFDKNGRISGFDGIIQEWVTSSNIPVATGQWLRVTMGLDYSEKTWRLNVDSILMAHSLGFIDSQSPELTHAAWNNSAIGKTYLDEVSVVTSEPGHLDDDGDTMPNIWEKAQGLDAGNATDASVDTDADGLSNAQEYSAGTQTARADTDDDGMIDGMEIQWSKNPALSNNYQQLPWIVGFEAEEGYRSGSIHAQNDWSVEQCSAEITSASSASGTNSLILKNIENEAASVGHWCVSATGAVVWTEMKLRMIPAPLPTNTETVGNSALFMLESFGHFAVYDGGSQTWVIISNTPTVNYQNWQRLTVRADYQHSTWSLYWNNEPILSDMGFADPGLRQMVRVALKGGCSLGDALDDLSVNSQKPVTIDEDADGLTDAAEDANGNEIVDAGETDALDPDTDGDGMVDGTEHIFSFDPVISNAFSHIPWNIGFENTDGYVYGLLNGQNGWCAAPSVVVEDAGAYQGTQAIAFQADAEGAEAVNYFGIYPEKIVWFDSYAQLCPGELPNPADYPNASVIAALNRNRILCVWNSAESKWIESPLQFEMDPAEWTRLAFRLDYQHKIWSGYIGNVRVFKDIPFSGSAMRSLSRIAMNQPSSSPLTGTARWDSLAASAQEPELLDNDADGLPNAWEILYALNPEDSSDARSDVDNDVLVALGEYLAGTDPNNFDTDGDGFNDWMEVVQFKTNPFEDQGIRLVDCFTISGNEFSEPIGCWETNGISAYDCEGRGKISYLYDVRYPSMYYLEIQGGSHGTIYKIDKFDLRVFLDDVCLGDFEMLLEDGANGHLKLFLPYLSPGEHKITLLHNGLKKNRLLRIDQLKFQWIVGGDHDANGQADWVENRLASDYGTATNEWITHVSPFCLEGKGLYPEFITTSLDSLTMSKGAAETWFRDVAFLPDQESLSFNISYENGALIQTNTISWTPYIMEDNDELHLRKGDMLRLALFAQCPTNQFVNMDVPSNVTVIAQSENGNEAVLQFNVAGLYQISSQSIDGSIGATVIVQVHDFAFPEMPICWQDKPRQWTCELDADSISLEYDDFLDMSLLSITNQSAVFQLKISERKSAAILARIPSGSIIASTKAQGCTVFSSVQTGVTVVDELADGTDVIEMLVVTDPIPQDILVRLEVFIAGVLFENGSTILDLTTNDFDELGRHNVHFLRAPGQETSVCHLLRVYQNEALVGQR